MWQTVGEQRYPGSYVGRRVAATQRATERQLASSPTNKVINDH